MSLSNEKGNQIKDMNIKHANPFTSAFKGTLGKGCGCVVLIILFFIFMGILSGLGKTAVKNSTTNTTTTWNPKTNTVSEQVKTYQQVFTFSGNGVKKSEPFTITGDRFKIKYDCSGNLCQAYLKKTTSEWNIQLIMNSANPIKDETIFYGAGEYYIDSNSMGSYSMVVEDYK